MDPCGTLKSPCCMHGSLVMIVRQVITYLDGKRKRKMCQFIEKKLNERHAIISPLGPKS